MIISNLANTILLLFIFFIMINKFSNSFKLKINKLTNSQLAKQAQRVFHDLIPSKDYDTSTIESSIQNKEFKSDFLKILSSRGFLYQCTSFDKVDEIFSKPTKTQTNIISAYIGFDATAKSLHIGSLIQIMLLRHLQKCGYKPIILIGGGTTLIGDPSGKNEARKMLSRDAVDQNIQSISRVFSRYLSIGDGPTDAKVVNNLDWLGGIGYLDFLRKYGRHFSINRMLSFDSVKQRLSKEDSLSFLEFNYMLLQAYDFVELNKRFGTILQMGGSDQWGNILCGKELGSKLGLKDNLYGLTAPLILNSDGSKMGKTAAGAIWLDKELCSEFEFWQFWRNIDDKDVIRYLKLFTEIPMDEIKKYENYQGSQLNELKIILADSTTAMLYGPSILESIHKTAKSLFSTSISIGEESFDSLDRVVVNNLDLNHDGNIYLYNILFKSRLCDSKKAAKRMILAGAVQINGEKISDPNLLIKPGDFANKQIKVSYGKKKHFLVCFENK